MNLIDKSLLNQNLFTYVSISFGGTIKLSNSFNAESILEFVPYLRSYAIAKYNTNFVLTVDRFLRLSEKIAAYFSNVLCNLNAEQ